MKNKTDKPLAKVFHYSLQGKREDKYEFLNQNSMESVPWTELEYKEPYYFFVPKDFAEENSNENGFSLENLFINKNTGIQTKNDSLTLQFSKNDIIKLENDFLQLSLEDLRKKYGVSDGTWKLEDAKNDLLTGKYDHIKILVKAFDTRFTLLNRKSSGFLGRPRFDTMKHMIPTNNLALLVGRQNKSNTVDSFFITKYCSEMKSAERTIQSYHFPLYLYPDTNAQQSIDTQIERVPNLNAEIVNQIAEKLGLTFTSEKSTPPVGHPSTGGEFAPIDILDYIYAVLHSPTYREKYKEFLKIDFPRVPYPRKDVACGVSVFWQLVKLGSELRQIHLLESPTVEKYITQYPIDGDNVVEKPRFSNSPPLEGCPHDKVENSPPVEGCPTGGVVDSLNNEQQKTLSINSIKLRLNPILELPYNPSLKKRARDLRQAENLPEVLFWMQVTKGGFHKIDFDRQRVIGSYIVDFYVKKLGLVIEIDGSSHIGKEEYDSERENYLRSLGLRIYRIEVIDVLKRMGKVITELENYLIENYGEPTCFTDNLEQPSAGNLVPPSAGNLVPPRPAGTPPQEGNMGRVYINETQCFDNVPEVAWNFYIGGYQPAQKWLKDRKGRTLDFEDILHYQKIIVALSETDRLMKEIKKIEIE